MATSSKQYKNVGEELWKGRSEKIVSNPPQLDELDDMDNYRMQSSLPWRTVLLLFSLYKTMKTTKKSINSLRRWDIILERG